MRDKLKRMPETLKEHLQLLLRQIEERSLFQNDPTRFFEKADAASRLAGELNDTAAMMRILFRQGVAKALKSEWDTAFSLFSTVSDMAVRHSDSEMAVSSLHSLGQMLTEQGKYVEAKVYLNKALVQSVNHQGSTSSHHILNSIGVLHGHLGDYAEALDHLRKALTIDKEKGEIDDEASTLSNIGAVFIDIGEYSSALEHCADSLR
jgi:tetratricopeptide (TPR) repeat protein